MHDLNEQISEWRAYLDQRFGPKTAGELEGRLRTIIDSLAPTGLSQEERLLIASHRLLGHPDTFTAELATDDPFGKWRERMAWMLVGLVPLHLLLTAVANLGPKIGSTSLMWGWSPWAAASLELALQVLIIGIILGSCLWAGTATRTPRWAPAGWFPASFGKLACLLAIIVVVFYLSPLFYLRSSGWGADAAHAKEFNKLQLIYGWGHGLLYLGFYIVAAVLIAWLVSSRRTNATTTT